ncbi:hypothetical protein [Streptomyces sp. NPDC046197]|uniref:hypothetical protein n=1 Tax=Streptomyces sp. NPDC046197 TaxID=3154337 RepID=UPI0033FBAB0C
MKSVIHRAGIPGYLGQQFLRATPPRLSKETGALLGNRLLRAPSARRSAVAADGESVPAELLERWSAEGGDVTALRKLLKMSQFRVRALRPSFGDRQAAEANTEEFSRFWASSGHDIEELSTFLSEVDQEAADWLPQ